MSFRKELFMNTHAINWFEIPVADFDRAKKFYETIFAYQMPESQMGPARMGFLLYDFQNGGRGGAIVHNPEFYSPSTTGAGQGRESRWQNYKTQIRHWPGVRLLGAD